MHTELHGNRTDTPVLRMVEAYNLGLNRHRQGHRVLLALTPPVLV